MKEQVQTFAKRPSIVISLVAIGLLAIANFVLLVFSVHAQSFKVASRYSTDSQTVIGVGNWYNLYIFGLFVLFVVIVNLVLSLRLIKAERSQLAQVLILMTILVLIASLLTIHSITGLVGGI